MFGYRYEAEPIKRLPKEKRRQLGIFRSGPRVALIDPVDRKELKEWPIAPGDEGDAKHGDLVRYDPRSGAALACRRRVWSRRSATRTTRRQISLIAIHAHGIPDEFPTPCWPRPRKPSSRRSRAAPICAHCRLVTIDPVDARDHDDAVLGRARRRSRQPRRLARAASPSPTSPHYVHAGLGARPRGAASAATPSISPTASCRCCRRSCPPICAR